MPRRKFHWLVILMSPKHQSFRTKKGLFLAPLQIILLQLQAQNTKLWNMNLDVTEMQADNGND